ncbi:MAG TPA: helix-turn-helix domain-containing protein [Burkholderiales bacterium]|nr:helix-turn-helix domain-containing protein [Burkholderiales bacterium]
MRELPGRQLSKLALTMEENNRLSEWTRCRKRASPVVARSHVLAACAHGELNGDVAKRLQVTVQMVGKWRQRFLDLRLDGLLNAQRSSQPCKISDAKAEQVIVLTLQRKLARATHWSARQMANAAPPSIKWL